MGRTIFLHSLTQGISSGIRPYRVEPVPTDAGRGNWLCGPGPWSDSAGWPGIWMWTPITSIARFKEEPSINKIIAEEKEQVGITEAKEELRTRRDTIFATKFFQLVAGPEGAHDVDDDPTTLALCVIDFNEATVTGTTDGPPAVIEQIFNNTGESGKFRTFRNRLLFLLANRQELDRAIDITREFKAIRNILRSQNRMDDLSQSQQDQIKQKEGEMDLAVRVAMTNAYRHLFLPLQRPGESAQGPDALSPACPGCQYSQGQPQPAGCDSQSPERLRQGTGRRCRALRTGLPAAEGLADRPGPLDHESPAGAVFLKT